MTSEMKETDRLPRIFQMMSLNSFGLSFISIFIPIYLLKIGYSFEMVMVWLIIHHFTLMVGTYITVYCSNLIGLVRCLYIRFALLLSYLLLIYILPEHKFLFFLIPILVGLESAFFWIPLNILFVRNTLNKTMGSAVSKFSAYPKVFSILGPVLGGLVITYFGFKAVFTIAIIIVFLAFIPLLPLRSEKTNFIFTSNRVMEIWQKDKKYFIPQLINNTGDAKTLWTLFMFISVVTIAQIGMIGSLVAFASIFFTLTIGKLTDRWDKHKLIKIGALAVSITWFFNYYIGQWMPNPWLFYISSIFMTFALKIFDVPYQSMLFNSARKNDAEFLVLSEVPAVLGRIIIFSLGIILYNHLPILFLIVGIVFLYFFFFDSRKFTRMEN